MNSFELRSVYLEAGSLCNLKCKHCYNKSGSGMYRFSEDQILSIFKEISKLKCQNVIISGGEPLLYKNLINLLRIGKQKYGLCIGLVTNGTMVDDYLAQRLSNVVDYVQISIDGTTPEENDAVRGKGTFQKAIYAIELFEKYKIKTVVNFVITGKNTSKLAPFLSALKSKNVSVISFKEIINIGRSKGEKPVSGEFFRSIVKELLLLMEELQDDNFEIKPPYVSNSRCPLYFENNYTPTLEIRISYTGEVFLCQKFETEKVFSLGNVNVDLLTDIMQSEKYVDLFSLIDVSTKFIKKCEGCFFTEMCFRECPATIISNGFFDYQDQLCDIRHFGMD